MDGLCYIQSDEESMIVCEKCQKENPDGSRFCGYCGSVLPKEVEPYIDEKKTISIPWKKYWFIIPIVLGIVLLVVMMKSCTSSKLAYVCKKDSQDLDYVYEIYGSEKQVEKVRITVEENDISSLVSEEDIPFLEEFLEQEKNLMEATPGVKMEYAASANGGVVTTRVVVTLTLDKIPNDYTGNLFVPYEPSWKTMGTNELKDYIEYWEGIGCE